MLSRCATHLHENIVPHQLLKMMFGLYQLLNVSMFIITSIQLVCQYLTAYKIATTTMISLHAPVRAVSLVWLETASFACAVILYYIRSNDSF